MENITPPGLIVCRLCGRDLASNNVKVVGYTPIFNNFPEYGNTTIVVADGTQTILPETRCTSPKSINGQHEPSNITF